MMTIRPANENDLEGIRAIYNEAVVNSTATFDTEERSAEKQREWFLAHKKNHPILVAEDQGEIIGWASLSPWSDRCAYDTTVEVSVYIHKMHRGKGLGSKLLDLITAEGGRHKNHTVLSRITQDNESSIHIHEKSGYRHIGVMKEVGFKFGRFLDVHIMQKIYEQN